ncbi:hypothetical protein GLOTRDRAFT_34214, partial [Gloeophyllum trabeum ATCC 11539]
TPGVHRFDWLPKQTMFYYNDEQTSNIGVAVSGTPSNVLLNVWSDGDPGWTKGPPKSDAIATVQYVRMYFNSTSLVEAAFSASCKAAGSPAACSI